MMHLGLLQLALLLVKLLVKAVGQAAGQAGQIGSKDDGCDGKAALNWLEGGISDRKLE